MKKTNLFFLFVLALWACTSHVETKQEEATLTAKSPKYAKRFNIKKGIDFTVLELLGNKQNSSIVTASFVLYTHSKPNFLKEAYYIKVPVTKVACMSSIYATMMFKLHEEKNIIAIDNVDYYTNPFVIKHVEDGSIKELSKGISIEVEKTIALKPDLILTFGEGNVKKDLNPKLSNANIPIAISIDHLEETPLARAEWIKFFSYFFKKENLADSLFLVTETNYNQLKALTKDLKNRPSVLTEIKYGDAWYVPAGKSYMANLLRDAGATYFWSDDQHTGSIPLSFEAVYSKAKDCDFWINMYNINSKKELESYDERYALFKAYKNDHLYNNNKIQNSKGFSNYWETGITNPDDILKELIHIFIHQFCQNINWVIIKNWNKFIF